VNEILNESFHQAVKEYFYLMNRRYPEKPTLKLICDHHRLTGVQRTILFRGITSDHRAHVRKGKLIPDRDHWEGKYFLIDGYNVLYTIMNHLTGKLLFIGNDGIMRDTGNDFNDVDSRKLFSRAVDVFVDFLGTTRIASAKVYFDSQVPGSKEDAEELVAAVKRLSIEVDIYLHEAVDKVLSEIKNGNAVCTSDSEIIDATGAKVVDAARYALESKYKVHPLILLELI